MTIELQPDTEALLRQRMERDGFVSMGEAVDAILRSTLDAEQVLQASPSRRNLAEFLLDSPLHDSGLTVERLADAPRPVDL